MKVKTARLGEITTVLSGTTPSSSVQKYWDGNHVWVTPTDLGKLKGTYISNSIRKITDAGLEICNLPKVPKGAIVMSSRAPIGHLAIAGCDLFTNQGCKSFVCSEVILNEYLYFLLQHNMPQIQSLGSGATFTEVSKTILSNFEISYPSLDEQKEIISKIKSQLAEVEKARQAIKGQQSEVSLVLERFREKCMQMLEGVPRISFGEVLQGIEAGKSFQTSEVIALPDELGVLKVSAVSWDEFLPQEAKAVESGYEPDEKHKIKNGDLILSRANTLQLVGAVVRVHDDYPKRLLSDKTLRLVVDEENFLSDYILAILKLPEAREHIEKNATGTSDSMRNISQKTIRSIPIPILTITQQKNMLQFYSQFRSEVCTVKKATSAILNDLNLLPQKILSQAFEN
jgi:type I restriction enzyme S subunit